MNRFRFFFVLALVLVVPASALAQVQQVLQKKATDYRSKAMADHTAMIDKYGQVVGDVDNLNDQIADLTTRYNAVKNNLNANQQKAVEDGLKKNKSVWTTNKDLLIQGGEIYKKRSFATNNLSAGDLAYKNTQWQAAVTEYGSCTSNAKIALRDLDKASASVNAALLFGKVVEKIIQSGE